MPRDWINEAQRAIGEGEGNLTDVLPSVISKIIRDRLWEGRQKKDGEPFTSFKEFAEYKLWWGLECPYERLVRYCEHNDECADLLRKSLVDGKTQQQVADELKVSQPRVSQLLSRDYKKTQSKRQNERALYLPQDPAVSAQKIHDKFGPEFAQQLKEAL